MGSGSEQPSRNMASWETEYVETERLEKSTESRWSYGLSLFSPVKGVLRQVFTSLSLMMGMSGMLEFPPPLPFEPAASPLDLGYLHPPPQSASCISTPMAIKNETEQNQ